jgi:hypothetical protein
VTILVHPSVELDNSGTCIDLNEIFHDQENDLFGFKKVLVTADLIKRLKLKESAAEETFGDKTVLLTHSYQPGLSIEHFKFNKEIEGFEEVIDGMDVTVKTKFLLVESSVSFGLELANDDKSQKEIRDLVINKGGYLDSERNYFRLDENRLISKEEKVTVLVNRRVLLYTLELSLNEYQIKRILTIGFLLLLKRCSEAEAFFYISKALGKGDYEVSIDYKSDFYVLIKVSNPLFSY